MAFARLAAGPTTSTGPDASAGAAYPVEASAGSLRPPAPGCAAGVRAARPSAAHAERPESWACATVPGGAVTGHREARRHCLPRCAGSRARCVQRRRAGSTSVSWSMSPVHGAARTVSPLPEDRHPKRRTRAPSRLWIRHRLDVRVHRAQVPLRQDVLMSVPQPRRYAASTPHRPRVRFRFDPSAGSNPDARTLRRSGRAISTGARRSTPPITDDLDRSPSSAVASAQLAVSCRVVGISSYSS